MAYSYAISDVTWCYNLSYIHSLAVILLTHAHTPYRINTKQLLAKKKNKEVPVEKQIEVCDKEIENAQKQLESYKKEIVRLHAKIEQLSEVNKVIDLEDEIKEKTEIKSSLKKEIKQLERNIHDQGNELGMF